MIDKVSTIEPIRQAYRRVRASLFGPIWIYQWAVIGFVAFAGGLVQGPSGFSYALNEDARSFVWSWLPLTEDRAIIAEFLMVQSGLRLVFALPSLFLVYLISVLLIWIGSRVEMAFMNIAMTNDVGIRRSLHATAIQGRSLFMFRLGFATLAFVALVFVILASTVVVGESHGAENKVINMLQPVATAGGMVALLLNVFLRNLVVPVMWRQEIACIPAIGIVLRAIAKRPGPVIVFLIVRLLWSGLVWVARIATAIFTCGLGFLPIIHHAICAPLYLFDRVYSAYVLEHVMKIGFVPEEPEAL